MDLTQVNPIQQEPKESKLATWLRYAGLATDLGTAGLSAASSLKGLTTSVPVGTK